MDAEEILAKAGDGAAIRRVFGDPIEQDGVMVIPVARVVQGGGGGAGTDDGREGSGGGFGIVARPVGAYRIEGGEVTWVPAVDVTRIAIGGQILVMLALLVIRSIARKRRRR